MSKQMRSDVDLYYPIVRCVVMGSDDAESFSQVQDAVTSTIKNIQSFYDDRVHIQFVFPADMTREGWSPLRGVPKLVNDLTNSWVNHWHDSNAAHAPLIHPVYTLVDDRAARPVSEAELSPRNLDKNEVDALFRLETSFGSSVLSSYAEWTKTVFYPHMWDMFANMSHEEESFPVAPLYALTVHVDNFDERSLSLENEAARADARVYSYNVTRSSLSGDVVTRQRLV